MNAARLGLAAYRDEDQSADSALFELYETRLARYRLNVMYRDNVQYSAYNRYHYAWRFKGLYRHMKGYFNFVQRLIDLEVNKTYGGRIGWAGDLRTGAIPIVLAKTSDPLLLDCIKQLLEWSNFGDGKDLYVRNGATFGDSFLKVVTVLNNAGKGLKVYLEVLDPHKVKDVDHDERGNVERIVIEYEDSDIGPDGKTRSFVYREEIDKKLICIWRVYGTNVGDIEKRDPDEAYENTYAFVPVVHVRHKNIGKKWGVTSFHSTLTKLDLINDGKSITTDGIRKSSNPMLVSIGGVMPSPDPELLERDNLYVFNLTKPGMDIKTITPQIDVAGAIANTTGELSEIESDAPALALQHMRKTGGELSGTAIANYYSDASDSLEAIQGNYDERLVRALQMALTIAGVIGVEGFPFTIDSYDEGKLRFYIKERRVFSDTVSMADRLRLIMEAANNPAWDVIARDLDVSDEDIETVKASMAEREVSRIAAGIRAAGEAANMAMDDEEGDEIEDAEIVEDA